VRARPTATQMEFAVQWEFHNSRCKEL